MLSSPLGASIKHTHLQVDYLLRTLALDMRPMRELEITAEVFREALMKAEDQIAKTEVPVNRM